MEAVEKRLNEVESIVATVFEVDNDFKKVKGRKRKVVNPKKVLCSILYNKEEMTFVEIAEYMGYENHTSVLFHVRSVEGICQSDSRFKQKIDLIYETIAPMYLIKL